MYRSTSFLLKKDYRVHIKAVEIILQSDCSKALLGARCEVLCKCTNLYKLESLSIELKKYYTEVRERAKGEISTPVSDTLISKVLLGTLACVPAYDEYFTSSVRQYGVTTGTFNKESILKLANFYQEHSNIFEKEIERMSVGGRDYPQMTYLDMAFWQMGRRIKTMIL
jgi:hypothetical protein